MVLLPLRSYEFILWFLLGFFVLKCQGLEFLVIMIVNANNCISYQNLILQEMSYSPIILIKKMELMSGDLNERVFQVPALIFCIFWQIY